MKLAEKKCVPCTDGAEALSAEAARHNAREIVGWTVGERELVKEWVFKNFREALAFVNRVGEIAEAESHHPDILVHNYKKVKITLWTHVVSGLTENDFIVAAKIDAMPRGGKT